MYKPINSELTKLTQQGLNALVNADLPITGNYLQLTKAAAKKFTDKLHKHYLNKKFTWDSIGNFGSIRMDDAIDNEFSDWGYMVLPDNQVILWPISTLPGLLYMQRKDTLGGIVKEGQYDCFTIQKAWWSGLPFLLQTSTLDFYRDVNMDGRVNRDKVFSGIFGFNYHSYKNSKWSWDIPLVSDKAAGVLSKGCQVIQAKIHALMWSYVEELASRRTWKVRYTLIHFDELKFL